MTTKHKSALLWLIVAAVIAVYTVRSFFPNQPVHHELNDAGGVLIVAWLLVWFFG